MTPCLIQRLLITSIALRAIARAVGASRSRRSACRTNVAADKHFWIARCARIVRCACSFCEAAPRVKQKVARRCLFPAIVISLLEVPLKLLFALSSGSNYCRRRLVFDRRLAQN